jgi:hypothetical protein
VAAVAAPAVVREMECWAMAAAAGSLQSELAAVVAAG